MALSSASFYSFVKSPLKPFTCTAGCNTKRAPQFPKLNHQKSNQNHAIMHPTRTLFIISKQNPRPFSTFFSHSSGYSFRDSNPSLSQHRSISSTSSLSSWMDTIKGVFTGKKGDPNETLESFTLLRYADELKNATRVGSLKQYIVGRSSEVTFAVDFKKQEAIVRCLSGFDPTGENLQMSHKQEAAKLCNCTIAEVENALSKFTWAKEVQRKIHKLKEEGKPMPKNMAEIQKLMGSTPLDIARSNLAKSGNISRNALCPCGSKKRYKRCCGKDEKV